MSSPAISSNPVPLKPPLKWAGGKRWLVPDLTKLWQSHQHRRYVEPFCGGLATALGLQPQQAVLNDVNPHLINFYKQLQRGLLVNSEMRNEEKLYYAHRTRLNELIRMRLHKTKEAAELFYYLNRTGFNGLCRFNQQGEFNVPFGTYKAIYYESDFRSYRSLFSRWTFTSIHFQRLKFEKDDFIYADPPYDVEFTTYSAGGFSWSDQIRTAEVLAQHHGPVVISNQATDRIVKLYEGLGFNLRKLKGPRRISCTGDRTAAEEVLATKGLEIE